MNLYIRIENGIPVDHPITEENLHLAYPGIDLNNNANFAKFQRNDMPMCNIYERVGECTYEVIDGVVHDVWKVEKLSKAEIKKLQDDAKARWKTNPLAFKSWKFNTATCSYEPPVKYPTDGTHYEWDETIVNWKVFDPTSVKPLPIINNEIVTEMIENGTLPTDNTVVDQSETILDSTAVDSSTDTVENAVDPAAE